MRATSELAHLFRALKAPAAARALPKLAERARAEDWCYERFASVLLATEVSARDSHGGEARIKAARFPARKTLEEFDFSFQRSVKETVSSTSASSTSCTPRTRSSPARPARNRQDASGDRALDPRLPGRPSRRASPPPPNGSPGSPRPSATDDWRPSSPRWPGSRWSSATKSATSRSTPRPRT